LIRELNDFKMDIPEIPLSPLSKCFDRRLLPKPPAKTSTIPVQTVPEVEKPKPVMVEQGTAIQSDLLPEPKKEEPEPQKPPKKIFDETDAYRDVSTHNYQEDLIS
jgi:hypothetical protein